ncbi:spore germination protein [Neobacillus niacini]|uniref:spore germination protein n=1 Tax=Neobacillus niacini TaxID=86668 RepID=UPI0039834520
MSFNQVRTIQDSIKSKIQKSEDIVLKELKTKEKYLETFYFKTLSDETQLQNFLIKPFFEISTSDLFLSYLQSHPKIQPFESEQQTLDELVGGAVILFYFDTIFILDIRIDRNNSVLDTTVETTIQGPQSGFSESLGTNLGLIRHRYPEPALQVESTKIGSVSKTQVMIIYDKKKIDPAVLVNVKKFLSTIDIEIFQSGEQLLDFTKKSKRTLFPTIMVTERPDRVAVNLTTGKIVLLVAGSPFAVIMPTVMKDLMSSMADIYQTYWIGKFLLTLRYIGLFTSIMLPAVYVALTSYNPEVFRVQLALSVAGSRHAVPYPSFIEVFLMLIMMELLMEASIRLPKAIGPTATTVGGLILGQAATDAGLVSNIMIIIVSLGAISNFVIPISIFSFAVRISKYLLLILSIFYGLVGVILGFFLLIAYMVSLDSFGKPFFSLIENKSAN